MERNKVKIDMEHKKMIMHDSDIKVLTIQSDAGVARTIKPLVLPAKSEVDIAVCVSLAENKMKQFYWNLLRHWPKQT